MKTPATILLLFLLTLTAPGSDIGEIHRIGNGLIGWYLLPGHFTASKAFDASQKANHSSGCGGTVSHTGTRDVLNMNGTSAAAHWSRNERTQSGWQGRAPGPDSPPHMTHSSLRARSCNDGCILTYS